MFWTDPIEFISHSQISATFILVLSFSSTGFLKQKKTSGLTMSVLINQKLVSSYKTKIPPCISQTRIYVAAWWGGAASLHQLTLTHLARPFARPSCCIDCSLSPGGVVLSCSPTACSRWCPGCSHASCSRWCWCCFCLTFGFAGHVLGSPARHALLSFFISVFHVEASSHVALILIY